jgi:hypothetical protein
MRAYVMRPPVAPDVRRGTLRTAGGIPLLTSVATLLMMFLCACRTLPNLPPADLSQPDWKARQGQAVWKSATEAPEIAGELLLATHPRHGMVLQFIKTPFPIVIAQSSDAGWKISFAGNREFSGLGKPPARISWFQLTAALDGHELPAGWTFKRLSEQNWRLENQRTGEFIEGYLVL